ncbi:hypothetical protein FSP39_002814 [Pinctada imbricata]|uniref:Integrase zinc-binding domain-containing protein n=1 Tax=Pinctada imbricata TaxID=66713 RepID=A0AA88YGI1_PINIB|nr:hypothetical protein FSP39_002814 [Pinctada imbricata]
MRIPVRIVNIGAFPVKLRRNSLLGELSPVTEFQEIVEKLEDPLDRSIRLAQNDETYDFRMSDVKERLIITEEWNNLDEIGADNGNEAEDSGRCEHDASNVSNLDFEASKQIQEDWREFKDNIDNVNPLGEKKGIPSDVRAVTRSQTVHDKSNWLPQYTLVDICSFQREDPDLGPLHEWIDNNSVPNRDEVARYCPATRKFWLNWENFTRESNVLYQKIMDKAGHTDRLQLLIPKMLQKEILIGCHDNVFAAHFGIHKTIDRIKQFCYWYKMSEDVKLHIRECPICSKWKGNKASLTEYRIGLDGSGGTGYHWSIAKVKTG